MSTLENITAAYKTSCSSFDIVYHSHIADFGDHYEFVIHDYPVAIHIPKDAETYEINRLVFTAVKNYLDVTEQNNG